MRFIAVFLLLVGGVCAGVWETRWLSRSNGTDAQSNLKRAIYQGDARALDKLVSSGVSLDVRSDDGTTPLLCAALFGREHESAMLINAGASVDVSENHGWTPCMMAAAGGYVAVLEQLIEAGADVNAVATDGRTAIRFAADDGHPEIVAILLKAGARPDPTMASLPAVASAADSQDASSASRNTPRHHHHWQRFTRQPAAG